MLIDNFSRAYNPMSGNKQKPDKIDIPNTAKTLLQKFDGDAFRELCKNALQRGFVSRQQLCSEFNNFPRKVDKAENKWPLPDPVTRREILTMLSTLDPKQATGSILPWRHSQCARPEAGQVLPNSPRTAMGHLRR